MPAQVSSSHAADAPRLTLLEKARVHLELLDPITWLGPVQCFTCSVIMAGLKIADITLGTILVFCLASALVGPLLTGFSQSINDYFDRHLDAINDPKRPIPSGRISLLGARANFILTAVVVLAVMLFLYALSGKWEVLLIGILGLGLGITYSAPGFRFKENGWLGTSSVGVGYCLIPWMLGAWLFLKPGTTLWPHVMLGTANALVAMGLIAMNDFKAIDGDRANGLKTIPVLYGTKGAMLIAFFEMNIGQFILVVGAYYYNHPRIALLCLLLLLPQFWQQITLYRSPEDARVLEKIGSTSAGRSLVSQSQTGAHPGFIRYMLACNFFIVAELTAFSIAQGYF